MTDDGVNGVTSEVEVFFTKGCSVSLFDSVQLVSLNVSVLYRFGSPGLYYGGTVLSRMKR